MAATGGKFVRELEVNSANCTLKITQFFVGDVGCVVWDAGIVLAKYLDNCQRNGTLFQNKNIIELGSGTGIVGLVAACLGAHVILTDLPEFVDLMNTNVENNKHCITGSAKAEALPWGDNSHRFSSPDIILISDCIYYEKSLDSLIQTVVNLKGDNTTVLVSYEERDLGEKQHLVDKFINDMKKVFVFEEIPIWQQHPDFCSPDIHLLRFTSRS